MQGGFAQAAARLAHSAPHPPASDDPAETLPAVADAGTLALLALLASAATLSTGELADRLLNDEVRRGRCA